MAYSSLNIAFVSKQAFKTCFSRPGALCKCKYFNYFQYRELEKYSDVTI